MKKILSFLILALLGWGVGFAQNSSLQFLYITTDTGTSLNPLMAEIEDVYRFAVGDPSRATIFYLADWDTPIIVRVNLPGDNRKDIEKLYSAMVAKSEISCYPSVDMELIPAIFERYPLRSANGAKLFSDVELRFYPSASFWNLSYNEQIISALWFIMDFDQPWARNYVDMNIFHQEGDGIEPDWEHPFGPRDLCANYNFQLLTY